MRRQQGFTLLELLVALSVSALMITLVYGAIVLTQRSAQSVNDRAEQSEVMRIGWRFIDEALARALPVEDPDDTNGLLAFAGREDRLMFVTDQAPYLAPGGLARITIAAREADDRNTLVLSRERFGSNVTDSSEEPLEATLVDDLEYLRLAYFGETEEEETGSWQPTWEDRELLPGLVEIRIKPTGSSAWPVLIARPMAGIATASIDPELEGEAEDIPVELLEEEPPEELFEGEGFDLNS
jgi:general secretion pathway protein J